LEYVLVVMNGRERERPVEERKEEERQESTGTNLLDLICLSLVRRKGIPSKGVS
jgi:hypothetical protein